MSLVRTIIAALLFLAWLPTSNCCLIAAAFPDKVADCCPGEDSGGGETTCDKCVTLENGVNLAALQQPAVPQQVWTMTDSLVAMLEKFSRLESEARMEPPPVPPLSSPPAWRHDVTKAQPVRGPSFAV